MIIAFLTEPSKTKSEDSFEDLAENSNKVVENSENVVDDDDDFEILDDGDVITDEACEKGSKLFRSIF
jgi:hypothetical protein